MQSQGHPLLDLAYSQNARKLILVPMQRAPLRGCQVKSVSLLVSAALLTFLFWAALVVCAAFVPYL